MADHRRAELASRIRALLDQAAASASEALRLMRETGSSGDPVYGREEAPHEVEKVVDTLRDLAEEADDIIWYALK